jgi:hypothetical protein
VSAWVRHQPSVTRGGDVGGDIQSSESWSARWTRQLADGQHGVVTRTFYATSSDDGTRTLECETEYLVCSDPERPGDTETWSDARYETVADGPHTSWDAEQAAGRAVAPTDAEWSSVMPSWAGVS